ncbi:MAG: MarR family transcriptional regulator [Clostridiales bacterium]|nr:MarR family transcriptional regulator [Clostridiales bacterium]
MELKHTIPCICMRLRRSANAITAYYDKALEEFNISTPQFSILINTMQTENATMSKLSGILHLEKSTLTRNISVLEKEGYVKTERGADRREVYVFLTESGIKKVEECYPKWLDVQNNLIDLFGGEENAKQFINTLLKLQRLKP